jgi:hypothetical protein
MSRFGRVLMVLALVGSAGVAEAVPAGAAGGVSCATTTGVVAVKPGLTLQKAARTLTAKTTYAKCTGGGTITSGVATAVEKLAPGSCLDLAKVGLKSAFSVTITWNTKATTTVTGSAVVGKGTVVTITGTVTTGLFKGSKYSTKDLFAPKKGQTCSATAPGITSLTETGKAPLVIK